jgi:hypothetical protein
MYASNAGAYIPYIGTPHVVPFPDLQFPGDRTAPTQLNNEVEIFTKNWKKEITSTWT